LLGNRPARAIELLAAAFNGGLKSRHQLENLALAYLVNGEPGSAALCYDRIGRTGLAGTLAAMADRRPASLHGERQSQTLEWLGTTALPLIRADINGLAVNLLVDTAAGDLVLDRDVAIQAGIPHGGQERRLFAGGLPAMVTYGHLQRLHLGDAALDDLLVQILDLRTNLAGYAPETPIHGILGISVLSRFTTTLDFRHRQLRLAPATPRQEPISPDDPGRGVRFWLADHQFVLVPLQGVDRPGLWALDTGMAGAAFAVSSAAGKNADKDDDEAQPLQGMGGGGPVQAARVILPRLQLDGLHRRDLEGIELPALPLQQRFAFTVAGLLGCDFFRDSALTLDFTNMRLHID